MSKTSGSSSGVLSNEAKQTPSMTRSKSGKKFYTVWRGNETGVFDSWKACQKAIDGYPGAIYKSFPNEEEAWQAFDDNYANHIGKGKQKKPTPEQLKQYGKPVMDSISVDAACNGKTGRIEYQGVDTLSGAVFFKMGPFEKGSNNIGEFLAIVHALAWCKKHQIERPIYTDSNTALTWVKNKKTKTKVTPTAENAPLFDLIKRAENWLSNNTWKNAILKWHTEAWGEIPADFGRK